MLTMQYRMAPSIFVWPFHFFYQRKLVTAPSLIKREGKFLPISLLYIVDKASQCTKPESITHLAIGIRNLF